MYFRLAYSRFVVFYVSFLPELNVYFYQGAGLLLGGEGEEGRISVQGITNKEGAG